MLPQSEINTRINSIIKSFRSRIGEEGERKGRKGHIYGLFEPGMARNETWRPLWKAEWHPKSHTSLNLCIYNAMSTRSE